MVSLHQILKKLIFFRTTHQPENKKEFDKAFAYIISTLKKLKVKYRLIEYKGYKTLIAGAILNPKITLLTHIDVVTANNSLFLPKIKKNKLFGRGAFDMKFAIASGLELLKNTPKVNDIFSLVVTSDEEIGGAYGTKHLIDRFKYKADCFVVPDGGDNLNLEKEAKGILHLKIISTGNSAHGSRPWLGKNAFDNFLIKYQRLRKYFPVTTKETWDVTLNLGKITGGKSVNSVCDELKAYFDIRYPAPKKSYEIIGQIKKIFKEGGFKVKIMTYGEPFLADTKNSYIKKWIKITEEFIGHKIKFTRSYGASDARFLGKYKLPVIVTRPKGGGHHSQNEWIDLKSLQKFYFILEKFVESYID